MNSRIRISLWLLLALVPDLILVGAAFWATDPARGQIILLALGLHLLAFIAIGLTLYYTLLRPLPAILKRAQAIEAGAEIGRPLNRVGAPELLGLEASLSSLDEQLRAQRAALADAELRHAKAMREIHHRIKNNLQVVSSLLSLQATRLKVPAGRPDFDMARQRLSALALLHRHLYDGKDFHSIELRAFCSDLVEHLRELAGYERTALIRSHINVPAVSVSADQAVLISLVITEAVTNAFRHAFPGNRPGIIDVEMTVQEGRGLLVIADDGVGLPEGRLGASGGDLGGLLIAGFVRQLRGTLNVQVRDGTRLGIEFPLDSGAA